MLPLKNNTKTQPIMYPPWSWETSFRCNGQVMTTNPRAPLGRPSFKCWFRENITNIVVVVTRYFGGIKLGTGGLVRAYTSSAKLGIQAAGPCDVKELSAVTYRMDYSVFNKVQKFLLYL